MPPRFALDQNFPLNIIRALGHIPEAHVEPLQYVDPALVAGREDWEILVELYKRGYDGFVTADSSMIQLPKELVILIQTRLTLVVVDGVGHDSVLATGLLLIHLSHIAHQTIPRKAQLWILRPPPRRNHIDPMDQLRRVAGGLHQDARTLFRSHRLPNEELQ